MKRGRVRQTAEPGSRCRAMQNRGKKWFGGHLGEDGQWLGLGGGEWRKIVKVPS